MMKHFFTIFKRKLKMICDDSILQVLEDYGNSAGFSEKYVTGIRLHVRNFPSQKH